MCNFILYKFFELSNFAKAQLEVPKRIPSVELNFINFFFSLKYYLLALAVER